MSKCLECDSECCKAIVVEIDDPKEDFEVWMDEARWMLAHENVMIYEDGDNNWHVEFATKCRNLTDDGKCAIYDKRMNVCRNHKDDECEKNGSYYKRIFKDYDTLAKALL